MNNNNNLYKDFIEFIFAVGIRKYFTMKNNNNNN